METSKQNKQNKQILDIGEFISRYQKEFGQICKEYIGLSIAVYNDTEYETFNSLLHVNNKTRITELYIDGIVIDDYTSYCFVSFVNLKYIHGIPTIKAPSFSNMFCMLNSLVEIDLSGWDVSKVTNMSFTFSMCDSLTHIKGLGCWDTSNVITMHNMFSWCKSLTIIEGIKEWDISSCIDMSGMFTGCKSLTDVGDLGGWDTSNVTDMNNMFHGCESLTHLANIGIGNGIGIGNWDMGSCINIRYMFAGCNSLKSIGNLERWDVSNVTSTLSMFALCKSLEDVGDLNHWATLGIQPMFTGCYLINNKDQFNLSQECGCIIL